MLRRRRVQSAQVSSTLQFASGKNEIALDAWNCASAVRFDVANDSVAFVASGQLRFDERNVAKAVGDKHAWASCSVDVDFTNY